MRPNSLKKLWTSGKSVAVGWQSTADTYVAETMANAGFDALVLDMQHGMGIGPDRAVQWLQVVSTTNTVPVIRVPWNEPVFIQTVLDAGAYGVIVPLVNNGLEAVKAGKASRYAPIGFRSVGPNRVRYYAGTDYTQFANEEIICLVMVEHPDTLLHLSDMAAAPGVDGFYIGPSDLAVAMGLPAATGQNDPRHQAACQQVLNVAKKHGIVAGIHCGSPEQAAARFEQGFQFCPVGSDIGFVSLGATAAMKHVREAVPALISEESSGSISGGY
jgi:4-hydroxy-2-oxoheptanedioate aldolase